MNHMLLKSGILAIGILGLAVTQVTALAATLPIWAPAGLEQLIEEGLVNNREIQSLEARVASARELIPFAGSLEDPRLGIGLLNLPVDTFNFDQEPMTQKQISLSQRIPWFGKLSLKEQRQALVAARQALALEARRSEIARQIAEAYYDLGFTLVSLEIIDSLEEMMEQVTRVAETRYASGSGVQQDVLQAQVELSKLLDEKISLKRKRRTLEDRINGLLSRETFEPIARPEGMGYPGLQLDVKSLQERALQQNPRLRIKQLETEIGALDVQLARKDYWPDMNFTVAYGQRDEDQMGRERADFFSATVGFNIPLWQKNRQDKNLSAKQLDHEATTRSRENLQHTLNHRVDALVAEITDLQENYRLFTEALMLQAEHWARSSLSSYVVGKVAFNTMINAQIRLLRFDIGSKKYLYTVFQKRAELEELLGGPLLAEEVPPLLRGGDPAGAANQKTAKDLHSR